MEDHYDLPEGMNMAEVKAWMRRVEESNEAQAKYAKKQYNMAKVSAACSVCVLVIVIGCVLALMPKLFTTVDQINSVMADMDTVVSNLETASDALAQADLAGMIEEVNTLVQDSQQGVTGAMEKISSLDIESMNEAIADLKAIVEPMSKLFRR